MDQPRTTSASDPMAADSLERELRRMEVLARLETARAARRGGTSRSLAARVRPAGR